MLKCIICLLLTISSANSAIRDKRECKKPITTASGSATPKVSCAGQLIFEDNFDSFDLNKWQHEVSLYGGGNKEFQWYVNDRQNTFTKNGVFFIKPTLTSDYLGSESKLYSATIDLGSTCTNGDYDNTGCKHTGTSQDVLNPIRSGRVHTNNSFAFKYGRVEIRAQMSGGDWLWPGLWFMPRNSKYDSWPRSGEIDLAESRGNRNLQSNNRNIGTDLVGSTLHWGTDVYHDAFLKAHYELYKPDHAFNLKFSIYELLWTPDYIQFKVNNEILGTVRPKTNFYKVGGFTGENPWSGGTKMAPFDQEFYIIFNLAVGGTKGFFPDEAKNYPYPKPWKDTAPHAMTDFWKAKNNWLPTWKLGENNGYDASLKVDYVRVWAI